MSSTDQNQEKNKLHYEALYANYPISNILHWINNLDKFLESATTTETSWFGLYQNNFREKIKGKKVLEMGCGDCTNAAVMAALGAEVVANDIASASGEIVRKLNENYTFKYPIKFVEGDFLENKLPSRTFDFVVGKAFLHHLTIPIEKLFLRETARLLKPDGEARFFEPAVNSKVLDEIRWHIPIGGRPSKFNKVDFKKWKEIDPHPDRSFSSKHWKKAGEEFFNDVEIIPVGTLER
ncbi:class I SAM-dependent methyltransferase [Gillisia sp. JM1]|uniref:class I SAM-dependent methyltransferase n=1 Tax=Gillisia sp. JM1 TaxID=1283286 RepID=UPI0004245DC5|nr:class I SAM-dependent methyltransferase [Gillisia sp. JM1]